jgi:hypothetical protein
MGFGNTSLWKLDQDDLVCKIGFIGPQIGWIAILLAPTIDRQVRKSEASTYKLEVSFIYKITRFCHGYSFPSLSVSVILPLSNCGTIGASR